MNNLQKFLSFNGKIILFTIINDELHIAVKPICEALQVDYIQQYKNIKQHSVFGPALCLHTMQVPGDQKRKLNFLPERLVYGWLMNIQSASKELVKYQAKCCEILYDYFNGSFSKRKRNLIELASTQRTIESIEIELRNDKRFKELENQRAKRMRIGKALKENDEELTGGQLSLFSGLVDPIIN